MESFHECVPEHANIKRNGKWLKMDSASVVPGDLLKVVAGQRVAADMRIIEVSYHSIILIRYEETIVN